MNGRRIAVVAPHPDDETLGLAGTLLRWGAYGATVDWIVMTTMDPSFSEARRVQREAQVTAVADAYGFATAENLGVHCTELDSCDFAWLVDALRGILSRKNDLDLVYAPYWGDAHSDHRVTFEAVSAALKAFPAVSLYCYETPSETDYAVMRGAAAFAPQCIVNITEQFERKLEILRLYDDEIHESPHPRSVRAVANLAAVRGTFIGVEYAEAFMIMRSVIL